MDGKVPKGRKPLGPQLVDRLDGSHRAKQRLEVILETIAGKRTIPEACEALGIGEAMFHRLRIGVLQAGLAELEPRPLGRPPHPPIGVSSTDALRRGELERQLEEMNVELKATQVRLELAQAMPQLVAQATLKKTAQRKRRTKVTQWKRKTRGGKKPR